MKKALFCSKIFVLALVTLLIIPVSSSFAQDFGFGAQNKNMPALKTGNRGVTGASVHNATTGKKLPGDTAEKSTVIPSISNKTIGKSTLPKPTVTLPITPSKATGITTHQKTSSQTIPSCPAGTIMINGKCVAKSKVAGALQ